MVDINGTLIAQILNFFVLVLILAKFAYKPLLQIMEERKQRIENDLLQAQRAKEEAETLQADYAAQLQLARKEAQAIVEAAQKQAEAESIRERLVKPNRQSSAKERLQNTGISNIYAISPDDRLISIRAISVGRR